ncbi:glycosyl transferase [Sesbania bispinosa]|nr:glycosyl transferase [Sesbania bispinosa]
MQISPYIFTFIQLPSRRHMHGAMVEDEEGTMARWHASSHGRGLRGGPDWLSGSVGGCRDVAARSGARGGHAAADEKRMRISPAVVTSPWTATCIQKWRPLEVCDAKMVVVAGISDRRLQHASGGGSVTKGGSRR